MERHGGLNGKEGIFRGRTGRIPGKMLEAGFDLLKEYGMTHMSVAKITEAAGIGVSTFYNFSHPRKPMYVRSWSTGAGLFPSLSRKL